MLKIKVCRQDDTKLETKMDQLPASNALEAVCFTAVQTKEDRTRLVYAMMMISLYNTNLTLKPGILTIPLIAGLYRNVMLLTSPWISNWVIVSLTWPAVPG